MSYYHRTQLRKRKLCWRNKNCRREKTSVMALKLKILFLWIRPFESKEFKENQRCAPHQKGLEDTAFLLAVVGLLFT